MTTALAVLMTVAGVLMLVTFFALVLAVMVDDLGVVAGFATALGSVLVSAWLFVAVALISGWTP